MKILVTGSAGFIGFHLVNELIKLGNEVIGIDSINDYYDINLKYSRLKEAGISVQEVQYGKKIQSSLHSNYTFIKLNIEDNIKLHQLFENNNFKIVCNLAAQAGVRYSLQKPQDYISSNIVGFMNILEMCRYHSIKHLIYASSSSVYGANTKMPLSVTDRVDCPISIYAATKKSNELMAYTYSHLFGLKTTGIRFFTVYGPWGRPDMAMYIFTKAILEDRPLEVYNRGDMYRDFTYITDVINGVIKIIMQKSDKDHQLSDSVLRQPFNVPYKIYNIGNSIPIKLADYIREIEAALNKKAKYKLLPIQPGDVYKTFADVSEMKKDFNYKPNTIVKDGIRKYVEWYLNYYNK